MIHRDPNTGLPMAGGSGSAPESSYHIAVPDNSHGGRGFSLPSMLFKLGELYLHGPVSAESVSALVLAIDYWMYVQKKGGKTTKNDLPKYLTLNINSPGGSVLDGLGLWAKLNEVKQSTHMPLFTVVNGYAASMGSLMSQAASPHCRLATLESWHMVHELSSGTQGKLSDQLKSTEFSKDLMAQLYDIYEARNTAGKKAEWFLEQEGNDVWLKPWECLKAGLADYIVIDRNEMYRYIDLVYRAMGITKAKLIEDPAAPGGQRKAFVDIGPDDAPASDEEKAEALKELEALKAKNLGDVLAYEQRMDRIRGLIDSKQRRVKV